MTFRLEKTCDALVFNRWAVKARDFPGYVDSGWRRTVGNDGTGFINFQTKDQATIFKLSS